MLQWLPCVRSRLLCRMLDCTRLWRTIYGATVFGLRGDAGGLAVGFFKRDGADAEPSQRQRPGAADAERERRCAALPEDFRECAEEEHNPRDEPGEGCAGTGRYLCQ